MIESNLVEGKLYVMLLLIPSDLRMRGIGKQSIPAEGPNFLKYGQSITDACISWDATVKVLDRLREGVQARRKLRPAQTNGVGPKVHIPIADSDFNTLDQIPSLARQGTS